MSAVQNTHKSGLSVDDAVSLIGLGIDENDQTLLRAEAVRIVQTNDGPRVVALLEALSLFAAGFLEDFCEWVGADPRDELHLMALTDHQRMPR